MRKLLSRTAEVLILLFALPVLGVSVLVMCNVLAPPMVVISGSMEPEITTGSLILPRPVPAESLQPGDVASLPRIDGTLVTHRVTANDPVEGGAEGLRSITMQGDGNDAEDSQSYVQTEALVPVIILPGLGLVLAGLVNHKHEITAVLAFGMGIYMIVKLLRGSVRKESHAAGVEQQISAGEGGPTDAAREKWEPWVGAH